MRAHELTFHRAYGAFLKGRLQSLKTGRPPGAPSPGGAEPTDQQASAAAPPVSDRGAVAEAQAQRKRAAEAVAPGAANGIGAPEAKADGMVDVVMKEKSKPCSGAGGRSAMPAARSQALAFQNVGAMILRIRSA